MTETTDRTHQLVKYILNVSQALKKLCILTKEYYAEIKHFPK